MSYFDAKYVPRTYKQRVNVSIDEGCLYEMTVTARMLGCSRSALIEFCWEVYRAANLDLVTKAREEFGNNVC